MVLNDRNRLTIRSTWRTSTRHNASEAMLPLATSSQNSEMTRPAQDRMSCSACTCDVAKADTGRRHRQAAGRRHGLQREEPLARVERVRDRRQADPGHLLDVARLSGPDLERLAVA